MTSPLGRYSDAASTIVAVLVILAWLIIHGGVAAAVLLGHPTAAQPDTTQIDLAATLVLGVILGQRAATNGAGVQAGAANLRLDAIGAPSAAAAPTLIAAGVAPLAPVTPPDGAVG